MENSFSLIPDTWYSCRHRQFILQKKTFLIAVVFIFPWAGATAIWELDLTQSGYTNWVPIWNTSRKVALFIENGIFDTITSIFAKMTGYCTDFRKGTIYPLLIVTVNGKFNQINLACYRSTLFRGWKVFSLCRGMCPFTVNSLCIYTEQFYNSKEISNFTIKDQLYLFLFFFGRPLYFTNVHELSLCSWCSHKVFKCAKWSFSICYHQHMWVNALLKIIANSIITFYLSSI